MNIPPFRLERHFSKYEFEVPFQLSCSDCEPLTLTELISMAPAGSRQLWDNLRFSYTDSAGHPLLRKEISGLFESIQPNDILVCVPEEGIFLVINSLLNPGDHIVAIAPAYQSLHSIATGAGCLLSLWEPDDLGNYHISSLKALVTATTRMVIINFPHNPTGAMIIVGEMLELSRFCEERGIILFSDEMYRGLEQDESLRLPAAADLNNYGISLSGLSKSFALPGLRIGWLACRDQGIRDKLIQMKDYTTICSSAPSEILGIIAIQNRAIILARNLTIIRDNSRLVDEFISRNPGKVSWKAPTAGSVAMLNISTGQTAEVFCEELLKRQEVLAIGCYLFDMQGSSVRLGLGRKTFSLALERVEKNLC